MAGETMLVPLYDPQVPVRVISLVKAKHPGKFLYLQASRDGTLKLSSNPEALEANYKLLLPTYSAALAGMVPKPVDAVISPPSNFASQAEPYRTAILTENPEAVDLTAAISRAGHARAGQDASLENCSEA